VHVSLVYAGKTKLVVSRERRPVEDVQRYFTLARRLDPSRGAEIDAALAELAAGQAAEAAAAGDWKASLDRYDEAAAFAPGSYRQERAVAYLKAHPILGAVGAVSMILLAAAAALGRAARGAGRS
jgi:hypothetical protein